MQILPSIPRLAGFSCVALMLTAAAQSSDAPFVDALKTFQQARLGDNSRIPDAVSAFEALVRGDPRQPVYEAYLGSAIGLQARAAWMPWNKLRYAERGLDHVDHALAVLQPEDDQRSLHGAPVSLETWLVAANLFVALPDNFFHRRAAGKRMLDQIFQHTAFEPAPPAFRAAAHAAAANVARQDGRAAEEGVHWKAVLSLDASGPDAERARTRLKELGQ